jgi:ankyrin repeat protein
MHNNELLESLRFSQIYDRQTSIKKAHAKTCRWLLKNPHYLDWLDTSGLSAHCGILWIKGKPGTGKSTLMKFAVSNAGLTMKQKIIISFFLNARGDDLEKSTIGLYRSLLLQLLEKRPDLRCVLDNVRAGHQWSTESLKSLFEEALLSLGEASVVCFIDALDECEESQIRDMVTFLRELTVSSEKRLRICFASRHYPNITVERVLSLELERQEEHRQDIASYMNSALNIGDYKHSQQIRALLQEKAVGIFMWVVLVVDILNTEYDKGRPHRLLRRLEEIPSDLHDLFKDMLTRDNKNTCGLLLCIQWVLFARHPLTPEELYFAMLSGLEPDDLSSCHSDEISEDDIRRYILDNSKGLAEYTKSTKSSKPTVQFIHESVRDFLLKEKGIESIWPKFGGNFLGQSHETLKQCCSKYTSIEPIIHLGLPRLLPEATTKEASHLREDVSKKFPFLEYVNQNVLYHAEKAESNGVSQKDFLLDFSTTEWLKHRNLFEKAQVRRLSPSASLSYILAEGNMPALIRMRASGQCFAVENERYGTPIFAALATNSNEAFEAILEVQAETQPIESALYDIHKQLAKYGAKGSKFRRDFAFSRRRGTASYVAEYGNEIMLAFVLATEIVDVNLHDRKGRTPLSYAAERGHEASIRLLLEKGARIEARDKDDRTPLSWAAMRGNEASICLLLEKGSEIETQDKDGRTPLSLAAHIGNEASICLLLENSAKIEAQDKFGRTPLSLAADIGNEASICLLLEKGAEIEAQDEFGRTPLSWAAMGVNEASICLLREKGAEIETQDKDGQTPLLRVAKNGYEAGARRLLEHSAKIEVRDKYGRMPLLWATENGHNAVVELLLEKGAETEFRDGYGRTPLLWAALDGHDAIVKLLLEKGANTEVQDKDGLTPLLWAIGNRHETSVRLLLEKDAKTEAQGKSGLMPLQWAAKIGLEASVHLLLEKGAKIDVHDGYGRTPLSWAAENGHSAIFRLLLEKGADAKVQDKDGRTPLLWAALNNHNALIRLLLVKGGIFR